MTRVLFDENSGRLRLSQEAAGTLLAWADGEEVDAAQWRALVDAGVVRNGGWQWGNGKFGGKGGGRLGGKGGGKDGGRSGAQPHPAVAPAVQAMADPLCLVLVHSAGIEDGNGARAAGWMGTEAAALLLDSPDGMVEVLSLPPMSVPAALARVLGLSPRPLPDLAGLADVPDLPDLPEASGVRQPAGVVEELFGGELYGDKPQQGSLVDHPVLAAIGVSDAETAGDTETAGDAEPAGDAENTVRWELSTRWPDEEGTARNGLLRVIDSPSGLWTVTAYERGGVADGDGGPGAGEPVEGGPGARSKGEVTLQPATATTVWRLLLRQFPG